jgi:hypothetical protein
MAEKITRQRAFWNEQTVTVLQRGRRTSQIRDSYGFTHEVPTKELDLLERSEGEESSEADFTFETPRVTP